ncbi:hypothetical protein FACS18942_07420 [Planctomycetales bacterium]|nr:hypothetical protein FACS18942_07420 [Planctomycetales bacterium]
MRYIVPFTVHNGLATIGKSVSLMRIQDVVNLRAQISGPRLFVSWDWQKGQDKVSFVYRNDKQPDGVNDLSATKKIVSRQDYDREKAVVLSADNTQDFYITVYSVVQHNGKEVYSAGVSTQTAVSEIHWKFIVHREYYLFGTIIDAKILIERRNGKGIPDLVVRKDFNRKPLGRSFGTVVMEIERSLERSVTVDFDDEYFADNARFQVFTKNESEAGRYALYGQNDETMKYVCSQRTFKDFIVELLYHPIRSLMQINTQIQQDFLNKK